MAGSAPAIIERKLTLAILRGTYAPGSQLPTVRELAGRYRVNQATIQRVVARLETRGLIIARQGSGLTVTDAQLSGDLSLLPLQMEAALDDPARALRLLEGVLEVRRVIAVRLLVEYRKQLLAKFAEATAEAMGVARAARAGTEAMRDADVAFTRKLLLLLDAPIALAFFNSLANVLEEVPIVTQALYAEPESNAASITKVIMALQGGAAGFGDVIDRAMADGDRDAIGRFERLLRKRRS